MMFNEASGCQACSKISITRWHRNITPPNRSQTVSTRFFFVVEAAELILFPWPDN
jgi:hypothetical protein